MPDPDPASVLIRAQEIIEKHAEAFDSVETIRVSPEVELNRGIPDWGLPHIRVTARQPGVLRGLPAELDGLPVRVVAATMEEQAAHFASALRRGRLDPGQARAWRLAGAVEAAPAYGALTYKPLPESRLLPVAAPMALTLHVSPEAGWPALRDFLQPAAAWKVAMYDLTAPHIIEALRAALEASGGTLDLCLGPQESLPAAGSRGAKALDVAEQKTVEAFQAQFGGRFNFSWASVGRRRQWPRAYHIKVAVREGRALWLSSGNWQSSNQPDFAVVAQEGEPTAETARKLAAHNREWHVIVENAALAGCFEAYIDKDIRTSQADEGGAETSGAAASPLPAEDFTREFYLPDSPFDAVNEAARLPQKVFPPLLLPEASDRPRKVQPILTPDNYGQVVLPLISGAKQRLWFQNQSLVINKSPGANYRALLDALKAKSWELEDCRIIFRDFFRPATKDALRLLALDGFDLDKVRVMRNCHTKGLLVDSRWTLLGSHNWTNEGSTYNRDASLLFDDPEVTRYFEPIVEHDWNCLAYPLPADLATPAAVLALPGERADAGAPRERFDPSLDRTADRD